MVAALGTNCNCCFIAPVFVLPLFFLSGTIHDIINRGGRCLIPVFALGRAQELLLILGEDLVLFHVEVK